MLARIASSTVIGGARILGRVHAPRTNTSTCLIPGNIPIPSGPGISSVAGVPACSDRARTLSRITCMRGATLRYHDTASDVTSSITWRCCGARAPVSEGLCEHLPGATESSPYPCLGVAVHAFQLPLCPAAQTTSARIDASHPLRLGRASRLMWPVRCPRGMSEGPRGQPGREVAVM